jgi:hypothetical protein
MTDTLVDPPPPPTVRDEDALRANAPLPPPKRRVPLRLLIALAILLAAAATALSVYFFIVRYEPVARRHIPGNANIVMRVEASEVVLFAPVRKHLWPIAFEQSFEGSTSQAAKPQGPSRAQRIKDATGMSLATDVREIVLASVDATSWVMLLGGRIPRDRFVDGIETLAREEGWSGWHREGPLLVGPPPSRVVIGQAEDGTIAVGTDTDVVTAALPATDEWTRMGLPEQGAVTFAATSDAWSGAIGVATAALPGVGASAGSALRRVDSVVGRVTLGSSPTLTVRVHPSAGQDAAALASDVERVLASMRVLLLLVPDVAGEKEAIASTKVAPEGDSVLVTTPWPLDGLDRACARLATWIRGLQAEAPSPSPGHAPSAAPAPAQPSSRP